MLNFTHACSNMYLQLTHMFHLSAGANEDAEFVYDVYLPMESEEGEGEERISEEQGEEEQGWVHMEFEDGGRPGVSWRPHVPIIQVRVTIRKVCDRGKGEQWRPHVPCM